MNTVRATSHSRDSIDNWTMDPAYLGDRSSIGGGHLRTLQRRGRARLGPEGRHSLANTVRQYKLLPQLDIRSSLGYSVLRARS